MIFSKQVVIALILIGSNAVALAGSLWTKETNNERSIYADNRAKNVGDILTIVVQETTTATKTQALKTYTDSTAGGASFMTNLVNQFIAGIPNMISTATGLKPPAGAPALTAPTLSLTGKDEYTGGGETTTKLTITNRTAVTVVDVLPNGNLVVEGSKIIKAGKETQYAYLRGIVRASDVLKDNTALSTNIADAQVQFIPEGALTDAQKKGWLLKIYERVRPF